MSRSEHRSGSDELLLGALAAGRSYDEAAADSGMSRATVTRRVADPAFAARLAALKAEMYHRAADALAAGCVEAVTELRRLLRDGVTDAVKAAAARTLLTVTPTWREYGEQAARIADLEHRLDVVEELRRFDERARRERAGAA